jgi:hypothetical protein
MKRRPGKGVAPRCKFSHVDDDEEALSPTYFGPTSLHAPAAAKEAKKDTEEGKDIRIKEEINIP